MFSFPSARLRHARSNRMMPVQLELPEDLVRALHGDPGMTRRARESVVLELLRQHFISQGKAAELLELDRYALVRRMAAANIPFFDYDPQDLRESDELARSLFPDAP